MIKINVVVNGHIKENKIVDHLDNMSFEQVISEILYRYNMRYNANNLVTDITGNTGYIVRSYNDYSGAEKFIRIINVK